MVVVQDYLIFMASMAKWVVHNQEHWMQELEFAIVMVVVYCIFSTKKIVFGAVFRYI